MKNLYDFDYSVILNTGYARETAERFQALVLSPSRCNPWCNCWSRKWLAMGSKLFQLYMNVR